MSKINSLVSLVIGRYQPFHDGHKALIQKLLDEGKNVCVAIRDTIISEDNPYSYEQRKQMIEKVFQDKIEIIKIPDIEEIVYGRKVGWGIRQIHLSKEIEDISATKIRKSL